MEQTEEIVCDRGARRGFVRSASGVGALCPGLNPDLDEMSGHAAPAVMTCTDH